MCSRKAYKNANATPPKYFKRGINMGIFDKLIRSVASEVVETIIEKVNEDKDDNNTAPTEQTTPQTPATEYRAAPAEPIDVKAYFADILASNFSQYQVRENIPLSEFGAEGRPYDFGLYQNGQLVSVVVLAGHNRTRNHPYWNSEKKAKELGIPFINFYTHMPNEKDFVIYRINHLMRQ